jgi:hypothetical protein
MAALDPESLVAGAMNPPPAPPGAASSGPAQPFVDPYVRDATLRAGFPGNPGEQPSLPPGYDRAFRAATGRSQGGIAWNPASPYYQTPEARQTRDETRALMEQYGFSAPAATAEATSPTATPTPTPAAPGIPATPAAPALDPRREELAWRAANPAASREYGTTVYRGVAAPDERAAEAASRRQELSRYDTNQAAIAQSGAEGQRALAQADLARQGAKSPDQMSRLEYESFLRGQRTPEDQMAGAMARYDAAQRARASVLAPPGEGGGGPPAAIDAANYLDALRASPDLAALRPYLDPIHGAYQPSATLPQVLEGLKGHRGIEGPDSPASRVIREALRIRFPRDVMTEAMYQFPMTNPHHAWGTVAYGDTMLGRGINRVTGGLRSLIPGLEPNRGSGNWFENYARGEEYRNLLKRVGIPESEWTYR